MDHYQYFRITVARATPKDRTFPNSQSEDRPQCFHHSLPDTQHSLSLIAFLDTRRSAVEKRLVSIRRFLLQVVERAY